MLSYWKLLKLSRVWEGQPSGNVKQIQEERKYIQTATQHLFRKNKNLSDPKRIEEKINEAEMRYQLAMREKNPFPPASKE